MPESTDKPPNAMAPLLEKPIIRLPSLVGPARRPLAWLNAVGFSAESLRGHPLLIDIWDYSCINCVRTLPYMNRWHATYADKGLRVIGIHAPEFNFAQVREHVETALHQFNITYPVVLDNELYLWDQLAARAWPTKFLVDASGYIRYQRQGEGHYVETEQAIQQLLREANPTVALPAVMEPLQPEDAPGAVCYPTPPELYAGFAGGGLLGSGIGNAPDRAGPTGSDFSLPDNAEENRIHLVGKWGISAENATLSAGSGRIVIPYRAVGINAVLAPGTSASVRVTVTLDGAPVPEAMRGADVVVQDGQTVVNVTTPRLYRLVRGRVPRAQRLALSVDTAGFALYTVTFERCAMGET